VIRLNNLNLISSLVVSDGQLFWADREIGVLMGANLNDEESVRVVAKELDSPHAITKLGKLQFLSFK
jgi:hypothetical protein